MRSSLRLLAAAALFSTGAAASHAQTPQAAWSASGAGAYAAPFGQGYGAQNHIEQSLSRPAYGYEGYGVEGYGYADSARQAQANVRQNTVNAWAWQQSQASGAQAASAVAPASAPLSAFNDSGVLENDAPLDNGFPLEGVKAIDGFAAPGIQPTQPIGGLKGVAPIRGF